MTKDFRFEKEESQQDENVDLLSSRRAFLKWSSAAALTAFAFGALNTETLSAKNAFLGLPIDDDKTGAVDLGKGDFGVLNYAYALEQLESAFYTQVIATPYARMSSE